MLLVTVLQSNSQHFHQIAPANPFSQLHQSFHPPRPRSACSRWSLYLPQHGLTQNRRICGHSSAAHQDEDEDEDEGEDDEDDVYHHWLSLWWWLMLWFFIQTVIAIPISAEHFPVIFSVPKKWRQKSQQHGVSAWIQTHYNVYVCNVYIYTMYKYIICI